MRTGWFVLILGTLVGLLAPPAAASPAPAPGSRADHLAAALRRDPVYVTDHAPRALAPDAAARIRAAARRLGVPVYVAVTPTLLGGGTEDSGDLVPLLRDRLRRDGVYIVIAPEGTDGAAHQYGGGRSLPVEDAWAATELEMPYDAGAVAVLDRFVEIAVSGRARERRDHPRPRPKSRVRQALDEDDASDRRAELLERSAFGGGAALSGLPLLALFVIRRRAGRRAVRSGGRNASKAKNGQRRKGR